MAIDLQKTLARELAKHGKPIGVKSAVLTLFTPGSRTPGALGSGTNPTSTAYSCKGFVEAYSGSYLAETTSAKSDRKISILGGSLPAGVVPVPGAKIAIADTDGTTKTFRVLGGVSNASGGGIGVTSDAVGAVYACHCTL